MARLLIIIALFICSCTKEPGHHCKYSECPYKGVTADIAHKSVVMYLGEKGTNAYRLDILHLQYPTENYEQLETRLFNTQK